LFPAILSKLFLKKVFFTGGIDELNELTTPRRDYFIQIILFKFCYLLSDKCIVVSKSDMSNILKIYSGKRLRKLFLSYHTIDHETFYVNDVFLKNNNFTTIGWMENISNVRRKGIDKSLILFEKLIKYPKFSDSKFYIIGKEGEGSDYLRELCRSLEITNKVVFTGNIGENEKISILRSSKYFFQLSTFEGFGIAAIEALAAKNIVIHSGNGALSETILNFGVKLNMNDVLNKNIESIVYLMVNFRSDLLEKAQHHIINNFSNESRAKKLKEVMEELSEKKYY
jgi:glycosyltransferase involved in cell wall biosynthesis